MLLTVRKWGNSAAIRLPAEVLNAAQLSLEQRVSVHVEGRKIVIDPTTDENSLDSLLAQITPDNVHDEVTFGPPTGKELL